MEESVHRLELPDQSPRLTEEQTLRIREAEDVSKRVLELRRVALGNDQPWDSHADSLSFEDNDFRDWADEVEPKENGCESIFFCWAFSGKSTYLIWQREQ